MKQKMASQKLETCLKEKQLEHKYGAHFSKKAN